MLQGEELAFELGAATGISFDAALSVLRHATYREIAFMMELLELLPSKEISISYRAGKLLQATVSRLLFVAEHLERTRPRVCRFETVRPNPAFL